MSQFDQHGNPTFGSQPVPPAKNPNRVWMYVGVGCLVAILLCVLMCAIGGFFVARNAKTFIANAAHDAMVQGINSSDLDATQKQALITRVDQLTADFKAGKLTLEDLGRIAEHFAESPLLPAAVAYGLEKQHLSKSGLTPEEREQARTQTRRLVQGAVSKKITQAELETVLEPVSTRDANHKQQIKPQLTDDELRQFIAKAQEAADKAEIIANPPEIDIVAEFNKVIDEALAEKGKPRAAGSSSHALPATQPVQPSGN